ncbi:MAG: thrombospondin type 3 repeat-containing protein, partial [Deltaproteobacteria bacterium]|nr:thrombospondin type 3 repeat-containing protein [Deltaproteobacteria bacterium]
MLLHVEAALGVGAVDYLHLEVYGTAGWEVRNKRLPGAGKATLPADVVLYPPRDTGTLRALVRAFDARETQIAEGTGQVAVQAGAQVRLAVVVASGKRADRDGDGVPDAVDNCPDEANPEQGPCGARDGSVGDVGDGGGHEATLFDGVVDDGDRDGPVSDGLVSEGGRRDGLTDTLQSDILKPDTAPPPPPPSLVVTAGGWGLRSPVYPKVDILAIHGSSRTNVWAVGRDGFAMRFDGVRWRLYPTGTTKRLEAVWTSGSSDARAVGENGTVLHFTSGVWKKVVSGTTRMLTGVWGNSPSDVWIAGQSDALLRWDGQKLASYAGSFQFDAEAITGLSKQEIWAVGRGNSPKSGGIVYYEGAGWDNAVTTVSGYQWHDRLSAVWA